MFGSHSFFRLWLVQVVSAFGDWLGFLALITLAAGMSSASGIAAVLIPRLLPGFFLASAGGVIVDRLNRKHLLIACDVGRAAVLFMIPLVNQLWWLVIASLMLELGTSLWGPAKEAVMPNLVPVSHLTRANSLSLIAAYGTFPLAAGAYAGLAKAAEWLGGYDGLDFLAVNQERLAIGVDGVTFLLSGLLIWTLPIAARSRSERDAARRRRLDFGGGVRDLRDGWRFILDSPKVRAILVSLTTGMFGGGLLIPLGEIYASEVLDAGQAGFGLLLFSLGAGVGLGVLLLSVLQRWIDAEIAFVTSVASAGLSLAVAASLTALTGVLLFVFILGVAAGGVYVLGFTLLHRDVADELRGRIFSALYTMVRFCLLLAIALGPLLASVLGALVDRGLGGRFPLGVGELDLPGVRLALWLAAGVILVAAAIAARSLHVRSPAASRVSR